MQTLRSIRASHAAEIQGLKLKVQYFEQAINQHREQSERQEADTKAKILATIQECDERAETQMKHLKKLHSDNVESLKQQHQATLDSLNEIHKGELQTLSQQNLRQQSLEAIADRVNETTTTLQGLGREVKAHKDQSVIEREVSLENREIAIIEREKKLAESVRMNQTVVESFERMRREHEMERKKFRDNEGQIKNLHEAWLRETADLKEKIEEERDEYETTINT